MSSLFSPRTRAPRLSPASALSRDWWNISMPGEERGGARERKRWRREVKEEQFRTVLCFEV
jgi:hypothetical protein